MGVHLNHLCESVLMSTHNIGFNGEIRKIIFQLSSNISLLMRKPGFSICENKDADQRKLRGKCEADQRLCFRYTDSTIPLLPKSGISILQPSSVVVQPGLCQTWSETPTTVFSQRGSYIISNTHFICSSAYLLSSVVFFSKKSFISC